MLLLFKSLLQPFNQNFLLRSSQAVSLLQKSVLETCLSLIIFTVSVSCCIVVKRLTQGLATSYIFLKSPPPPVLMMKHMLQVPCLEFNSKVSRTKFRFGPQSNLKWPQQTIFAPWENLQASRQHVSPTGQIAPPRAISKEVQSPFLTYHSPDLNWNPKHTQKAFQMWNSIVKADPQDPGRS